MAEPQVSSPTAPPALGVGSGLCNDPRMAKRPRLADGVTAASAGGGEWVEVISELQPAIVALRVTHVRSFEEDPASTAQGTGFVVDKERGLILTNRHITGVGPVRATATFDRHEELEVEVIYRDPVHDFGFFRYDPSQLRLTRCAEIGLDPQALQVGAEIRVIGNDAGEKLQILSGTIARVDRNVPEFNTIYNDENTFYAGAGASTSGGSSGSPVLNKQGRAVALNAAGQEGAASAYFLPLDRVAYAFERLRHGNAVPRGTCMASFLFKPFDELKRVGLRECHEIDARAATVDATGMLMVDNVLCEQQVLRPGDILLSLQGQVCANFAQLEEILDASVGRALRMLVCRGDEELSLEVQVTDLHALIPRSFVELGLDTLHAIGYHAAKRMHLPMDTGMYLAKVGHVFDSLGCGRAAMITAVGKTPTPTAEAFVAAVSTIPHRQYFQVSWYELADFRRDRTLKTGFAKMSRAWFPLRLWRCEVTAGGPEHWVPEDFPVPEAAPPPRSVLPSSAVGVGGDQLVRRMKASLVSIRFRTDRRMRMESNYTCHAEGAGLLVDAERGLVLTDRHSAPQSLGDVEVTLAGMMTVDAEVLFIHPMHNLVMLRCDPSAFAALRKANVPLRAADLATGAKASLRGGERLHFVGYDNQGNTFSTDVTVAAVYLPSGRDEFPLWDVPRFRERNLEIAVLADTPEDARGGVICDSSGCVRALFAAFDMQDQQHEESTEAYGVVADVFRPMVDLLRADPDAKLEAPSLDVEVTAVDVATLARGAQGQLPRSWLQAIAQRCGRSGQAARAMCVHRVMPTGASDGRLQPGDVLMGIGGQPITCCLDIDRALALRPAGASAAATARNVRRRPASAAASSCPSGPSGDITVSVFRDGKERDVVVPLSRLPSADDEQLLLWAGLVLRRTPRCILERCGVAAAKMLLSLGPGRGVFVQHVLGGSPADTREIGMHCFVLELAGRPVRELEDIVGILQDTAKPPGVPDAAPSQNGRRWVRLRLMDTHGQEHVRALRCDPLYFPTLDLRRVANGRWQCTRPGV